MVLFTWPELAGPNQKQGSGVPWRRRRRWWPDSGEPELQGGGGSGLGGRQWGGAGIQRVGGGCSPV
jgi:hypothetical protein